MGVRTEIGWSGVCVISGGGVVGGICSGTGSETGVWFTCGRVTLLVLFLLFFLVFGLDDLLFFRALVLWSTIV